MKYCANCKTVYPADFQCCPKDGSALSSSSELLPGMVIRDKYQILQQIGSGGMATVYQVRHLAFNEILAIKLINSQLADGDQFNKRLRAEAVIARKLQHPNAVHVEDLDRTEDGRPFIVMEYVEGQNLRTIIRREGPLPTLRALRIAAQVVSALAAAHKLGIIHRDIKPDNIHLIRLPDGSDFVKVLDFGIAKFTQGLASSALTGSGLVVGTPQYVSPEQAMGKQGGDLDGRSDLYTLGIVLYEMVTGRVPFDSDTPVGLLVHHLHTTPVPPDQLRPDLGIPPSVSELLMKALQKHPEQRFRNADEMLNTITKLEAQIQRVQETTTVESGPVLINPRNENPEPRFQNAAEMLSAITPVEQPAWLVQGTGTPDAEAAGISSPEEGPDTGFRIADGMLSAVVLVEQPVVSTEVPEESPEHLLRKSDGMLAAIPPVEDQVEQVGEIAAVLMKPPEASVEQPSPNADDTLNPIASVEEPAKTVEPSRTVSMKAPEASPDLHFHEMPSLTPSVEEPVHAVEPSATVLIKAADANPYPHFSETPSLIPSVEESAHAVEPPPTILMKALEVVPDITIPKANVRVPSESHLPQLESPGGPDLTVKWAAPPDPPRKPMWPREAPKLRSPRAPYKAPASRRLVYIGIAMFAAVCLAVLGISQWRGASAKPPGQSAPELHDQSVSNAGASTLPATQVSGGVQAPATQHSTAATHSIAVSDAGVTPSGSPASLAEPEKLGRVKDLVSQGWALSDSGEYASAIDKFDSALKLDPQSSEAKAGKRRAKERLQLEQALPLPNESK
jgi:serine/threonine protein kinase